MKTCKKCNEIKEEADFHKNVKIKSGLSSSCKACTKNYRSNWYLNNKEKTQKWNSKYYESHFTKLRSDLLKKKYGIDSIQYESMLRAQNYKCAICGIQAKSSSRAFAVDHNHLTNKIRGLLCYKCNKGLGLFDSDLCSDNLKSALRYIEATDG